LKVTREESVETREKEAEMEENESSMGLYINWVR
jgi:hypothetical protein